MVDTEHENGSPPDETASDETVSDELFPAPPPDEVVELVVACEQYVQRATGIELDLTPETLPVLDHYLQLSRDEINGRPELLPLVTRACAAYLGELIRLQFGGFWLLPTPNSFDWLVCCKTVFLSVSPLGIVYDALHRSSDHEGPSSRLRLAPEEREVVEHRLAQLPQVSEDEYYLFSTRFEVLDIAVDALRRYLQETGYEDVEFTKQDYLHEMKPLGEA